MSHSFEEAIIRHCAATLAGHKCGSLFCCAACTEEDVDSANAAMNLKGVRVVSLRTCGRGTLVYVYRRAALNEKLADENVKAFLSERGYDCAGAEACIERLRSRIEMDSFPHEIGVFLGYPLADVIGFIQNRGKNFTACGYWKVYTDPSAAQKAFDRYKKCERIYARCYYNGTPIRQLTVAA